MSNNKKKKRKLKPVAIYAIIILLALICSAVFVIYKINYNHRINAKNTIYEELSIENKPQVVPSEVSGKSEAYTEKIEDEEDKYARYLTEMFPDFDALKTENKDVIAYICIPGTNISYPVMKGEDNEYYLHHNFDGSTGYPGCIYMEVENSSDFDDQVTILYGHNMKSGIMFHELHNYADLEFMKENKYVIIYTPNSVNVYEIFLSSNYSQDHLFSSNYVKMPDGSFSFKWFKDNQNEITISDIMNYGASNLCINNEAYDYTKDLLVLSTCNKGNKRFLVVAKKIEL